MHEQSKDLINFDLISFTIEYKNNNKRFSIHIFF